MRSYRISADDTVPALKGVDLDLHPGTVTALIGPSGSGKSTLLRLLACVDRPDSGSILIQGRDTARLSRGRRVKLRRRRLGYMFQNPADNLLDYLTVRQHLRLAAQMRGVSVRKREADELLERLGLGGRADNLPRQLSGGEQQRAAIAFAAIGPPALLVADEPTGQLDHDTSATSSRRSPRSLGRASRSWRPRTIRSSLSTPTGSSTWSTARIIAGDSEGDR